MKVKELKERLEGIPDDYNVQIVVKGSGIVMGTPTASIKSIAIGFDWNAGKLLLFPTEQLTKEPKEKK